jgi:hypothetical protein
MQKWTRIAGLAILIVVAIAFIAGAEPRYALIIGNGDYTGATKLKNPVNDATDISEALKKEGFEVQLLLNADMVSMEDAVIKLGEQVSKPDATGFFFYAGHGVQSGGGNYLVPVDARIPNEAFLKAKAISVQTVLDTLQEAGNNLNIVVLDACRDNPFSWSRSASRGLTVVGSQPPGSIITYATSAGSVAQDGDGRNGVFTTELLKNLSTPGLEINDVFKRTGAAVQSATGGKQVPAIYSQFFQSAYLAGRPVIQSTSAALPPGSINLRNLPVNVSEIRVSGIADPIRPEGGDTQTINNLPGGTAITVSFVPQNLQDPVASFDVTPESDRTLDCSVPGGTVSFSWLPNQARVTLQGVSLDVADDGNGNLVSERLLPGSYTLQVALPGAMNKIYTDTIQINAGKNARVTATNSFFLRIFEGQKEKAKKDLQLRKSMDVGGWVSLATGVVGAAVAGAMYYLGTQRYSTYSSSTSTSTVDAARSDIETYGMVFLAGAAVGGVGLGASPILFFTGPKQSAVNENMKNLDREIQELHAAGN